MSKYFSFWFFHICYDGSVAESRGFRRKSKTLLGPKCLNRFCKEDLENLGLYLYVFVGKIFSELET